MPWVLFFLEFSLCCCSLTFIHIKKKKVVFVYLVSHEANQKGGDAC
ncbi:hypothetical protein GLYMA_05G009602v4 [Glycine max]|nr:hypothetical protein GLYMA_05G009602v4 [Glycine max]KAH1132232.1 hypothetical protein GYH30_011209 [Glycine max]